MKLCWLLTTFQSDAASAHWRPSLVSDKHVPACRFQSVSPGTDALVWFHAARGESERCILLWCLVAQTVAARHLSSCWRLLLSSAPRVLIAQERWAAATQDSELHIRHVASQQTRPQFCRLQIIGSHSGMRLSETIRDIIQRWWAVVINRITFYQQNDKLYFTR